MRGKTIYIHHSSSSSYLIFSLLFVMGIVTEQWEVITIVTLALIIHSLLDLVEIRDIPIRATDDDDEDYEISWRFGDRSLFTSK